MSLPIAHLGDNYTNDVRALLRNNVPDVAQILKGELTGQTFRRNVKFVLTSDKKFQAGKTYYTRRTTPSRDAVVATDRVWRYDIATVTIKADIPANTYYELTSDEVILEGYPTYTLPRGYNGEVYDIAFDTRWDDGIGMYRMPLCTTYPNIQGYNVFATPLVLEGIVSYLVKMTWRLRLLIDGSLSTLIDKFVITKNPPTEVVENNNAAYLYEQTADTVFQANKQYYRRAKNHYYAVTVEVGKPVRTQTGYKPTEDTVYLANKDYYKRITDTSTLAGYRYSLLVAGRDYTIGATIETPGSIYNPVYNGYNNYYERTELPYPDYYMREVENDSTTPKPSRYYAPVASGEVVSADKVYYCYNVKSNTFVRCALHPSNYTYYTCEPVEVPYPTQDVVFADKKTYFAKCSSEATYKTLVVGTDYHVGEWIELYCREHGTTADPCVVYELISSFNYKAIDLTDPKWKAPDAFNGITIYRMEFGSYYCVGKGTGCNCLMIGVSQNTTYTEETWDTSKLYTQVQEGVSVKNIHGIKCLYVDPTDEDICRIKDLINLFLTRYRTILLATNRKPVNYAPIKGDMLYTTTELIERINAIVNSMKSYADPIEEIGYRDATDELYDRNGKYFLRRGMNDYVLITNNDKIVTVTVDGEQLIAAAEQQTGLGNQPIYINAYTARDMKLKVNEIIDFIVNESYYFHVFRDDFVQNLLTFESDFWNYRNVSKLLYKMATESDEPPAARNYNDRWFFYDPSLPYITSTYEALNLTDILLTTDTTCQANKKYYKKTFGRKYVLLTAYDATKPTALYNYKAGDSITNVKEYASISSGVFKRTVEYYKRDATTGIFSLAQPGTVEEVAAGTKDYVINSTIPANKFYTAESIDEIYVNRNESPETTLPAVVGTVYREAVDPEAEPAIYGGYHVYTGADNDWVPLCRVANVYNMADNWSNCNYSGCMQVLNLTLNMLQAATPEQVSWKEGIYNPKKPVTPEFKATMEDVLDQIELMEDRVSMLLEYAPHVADIMVDIGYHVTTQFKMSMEESIPVREVADMYIAGKVYSYYSTTEHKYRGVVINSAAEFKARQLLYGTLYTWNFYHNKK